MKRLIKKAGVSLDSYKGKFVQCETDASIGTIFDGNGSHKYDRGLVCVVFGIDRTTETDEQWEELEHLFYHCGTDKLIELIGADNVVSGLEEAKGDLQANHNDYDVDIKEADCDIIESDDQVIKCLFTYNVGPVGYGRS